MLLPTRPEDVLDPGDGATGVSPAGSGAPGWLPTAIQSLHSFNCTAYRCVVSGVKLLNFKAAM